MKKYFTLPAIFFIILFPGVISYAQVGGKVGLGMDTDKRVSLIVRPIDHLLMSFGANILFADIDDINEDTISGITNIGIEFHFSPEEFSPFLGLDLGVGVVPGFSRFYGKQTIVTLKPSIGVEYFPKDTFCVGSKISPFLTYNDYDDNLGFGLVSELFVRWYFSGEIFSSRRYY